MADEPREEVDAAQAALNRVRQAAEARGEVRTRTSGSLVGPASGGSGARQGGRRRGAGAAEGYSGRDPQGLGSVMSRMVADRGWSSPVAVGSVIARWPELVGPEVAAHCTPESFEDTTLRVRCDSTAWATQLRLLSTALLDRFARELGPDVVRSLHVLGPAAPSWRKGARHVRGRGPRDTYG
ncbi:DciA family protein [Sinomonas sp. JGH33]|uniref:DciA family protein n=1 Tax=Sinomonas terricola TaxID=3110330 RepID=A0ABU5T8Y0_9MICC|nr:DciA family protein [Sinomonas sp. JGH33]MEA5455556.1 DciA family protein [Sinomonas sp. JGH33]